MSEIARMYCISASEVRKVLKAAGCELPKKKKNLKSESVVLKDIEMSQKDFL